MSFGVSPVTYSDSDKAAMVNKEKLHNKYIKILYIWQTMQVTLPSRNSFVKLLMKSRSAYTVTVYESMIYMKQNKSH